MTAASPSERGPIGMMFTPVAIPAPEGVTDSQLALSRTIERLADAVIAVAGMSKGTPGTENTTISGCSIQMGAPAKPVRRARK